MADNTTKTNASREINRETTGRDHKDTNPDLITGAPGSHPIGTGVGAAAGGTARPGRGGDRGGDQRPAAPIGAAIGAIVGAIGGGLAGKGVAETIDPTAEDAYWKEQHKTRDYTKAAGTDLTYDKDYKPAYQYGWESTGKHAGKSFDQAEPELAKGWESARGESKLGWDHAKHATRDAWDRLSGGDRRAAHAGRRRDRDRPGHQGEPGGRQAAGRDRRGPGPQRGPRAAGRGPGQPPPGGGPRPAAGGRPGDHPRRRDGLPGGHDRADRDGRGAGRQQGGPGSSRRS
jgi:hypothetical protein